MRMMKSKTKPWALLAGLLGCLCFGGGDWLMMYGDPTSIGKLKWLTIGTAAIPQWRYILAMVLAFPGIVLYGSALFAAQNYITDEKKKKVYHYLNAFGLTPWIALHLIYVVILSLFAWLNNNGFSKDALLICESLYDNYSWLIPVCEGLMLPVFLYWFYVQITGNTIFKKGMAFTNVSLGIVHSIAQTLGGIYHVSHGLADAVILPYIIEYNYANPRSKEKYDEMAKKLGKEDLAKVIVELNDQLNIPRNLKGVITNKEDYYGRLEELADIALKDGCTKTAPIIPSLKGMEDLFVLVYEGR